MFKENSSFFPNGLANVMTLSWFKPPMSVNIGGLETNLLFHCTGHLWPIGATSTAHTDVMLASDDNL